MTREQVAAYATSDQVAPPRPHRSRIVLPLHEGDAQLDALIVHELTHVLVSEIILPGRGGDGGMPRWVQEGMASYMVPRVDKTYDAVFDLTPAKFDAAFRQYAERRFASVIR